MKANELRIGNYYDHNGEIKQVTPNVITEVWESERSWCKAIPLSEEWLKKFGFKNGRKKNQYDLTFINVIGISQILISIYFFEDKVYSYVYNIGRNDTNRHAHVHQLQNLYFALTGEELTINQ